MIIILFSVAFSSNRKYLYLTDFNTKAVIKYQVEADGFVGEEKKLFGNQ